MMNTYMSLPPKSSSAVWGRQIRQQTNKQICDVARRASENARYQMEHPCRPETVKNTLQQMEAQAQLRMVAKCADITRLRKTEQF